MNHKLWGNNTFWKRENAPDDPSDYPSLEFDSLDKMMLTGVDHIEAGLFEDFKYPDEGADKESLSPGIKYSLDNIFKALDFIMPTERASVHWRMHLGLRRFIVILWIVQEHELPHPLRCEQAKYIGLGVSQYRQIRREVEVMLPAEYERAAMARLLSKCLPENGFEGGGRVLKGRRFRRWKAGFRRLIVFTHLLSSTHMQRDHIADTAHDLGISERGIYEIRKELGERLTI